MKYLIEKLSYIDHLGRNQIVSCSRPYRTEFDCQSLPIDDGIRKTMARLDQSTYSSEVVERDWDNI